MLMIFGPVGLAAAATGVLGVLSDVVGTESGGVERDGADLDPPDVGVGPRGVKPAAGFCASEAELELGCAALDLGVAPGVWAGGTYLTLVMTPMPTVFPSSRMMKRPN